MGSIKLTDMLRSMIDESWDNLVKELNLIEDVGFETFHELMLQAEYGNDCLE